MVAVRTAREYLVGIVVALNSEGRIEAHGKKGGQVPQPVSSVASGDTCCGADGFGYQAVSSLHHRKKARESSSP